MELNSKESTRRDGKVGQVDIGFGASAVERSLDSQVCLSPHNVKKDIHQDVFPRARDGAVGPVDQRFARTEEGFMSSETLELRALPGFDLIKKRYPIGYLFFIKESARRDSNPRPRPWQGRAPPTEPLAHKKCYSQAHGYYTI